MEARSLIHFAVWGGADQRGALHRTKGRAGLPSTLKGWTCLTFKLQSLSDLLGQHTHFTGWESRCKNEWGSDLSKATLMIQKRWLPNMPASSPPDPSHKSLPQAPALIPLARLSLPSTLSSNPPLRPLKPHSVTHGAIPRLIWNFFIGGGALFGSIQGVLTPTLDELLPLESALERPMRHFHFNHRLRNDTAKGQAFECIWG